MCNHIFPYTLIHSHIRIYSLTEPIVQTFPTYPSVRSSGDYLPPATSMHLQVTSQDLAILLTSSSASEVSRRPMNPQFDVLLVPSL